MISITHSVEARRQKKVRGGGKGDDGAETSRGSGEKWGGVLVMSRTLGFTSRESEVTSRWTLQVPEQVLLGC